MDPVKVPTPKVVLRYAGKDITADVGPALIEATYTDELEGQSDSVELVLEDVDRRWQNGWYPQHGDILNLSIGYAEAALLPCGDFEIDEIELSGPPDVLRIRALAAGVKRSVRTFKGRPWENTTLADIAKSVAQRNRLTIKGQIEHVAITYVAQTFETDLTFLSRLMASYGYAFSVRGQVLSVFKRADLKQAQAVLTLRRGDVKSFRFRDKVHGVFQQADSTWFDSHQKTTRKSTATDPAGSANRTSADTLRLNVRAETDQQARLKSNAALDRANEDQTGADMALVGNVRLMAGVNVQIAEFGRMDGKYTIARSRHAFNRSSGYTTDIELKRVRDPAQGAKK